MTQSIAINTNDNVTDNWQRLYINSQVVAAVTQILGYKQAYNRPIRLGKTNNNTVSQY